MIQIPETSHHDNQTVNHVGVILGRGDMGNSHVATHGGSSRRQPHAWAHLFLERTAKPLLKADRPWESMGISPDAVLRIGNQWHLWYVAFDQSYGSDNDCHFCYARSRDGVHWEKPEIGLYFYHGNTNNNILMFGFNFCSFIYDEHASPAQRFKAVGASQTQDW